jgi:hypothetical protein
MLAALRFFFDTEPTEESQRYTEKFKYVSVELKKKMNMKEKGDGM